MGVCETGRAACSSTDTLAEVNEYLLRLSCRTKPTQMTIDNLDFHSEHMTIAFKQVEKSETSHLDDKEVYGSEVLDLFDVSEILIENEKHTKELSHVNKLAANSVGRLLGGLVEKVCIYFFLKIDSGIEMFKNNYSTFQLKLFPGKDFDHFLSVELSAP